MKAPHCEICGSREASGYEFANYQPLPDGMKGHPRGYGHFCMAHDASAYTHLSMGEAIKAIEEEGPSSPPRLRERERPEELGPSGD